MMRIYRVCVLAVVAACGNSTSPVSDSGTADAPIAVIDATGIDAANALDATMNDASPDAQINDASAPINGAVDVLFVIDNSGSMEQEQAALSAAFGSFVTTLETTIGGRPSLHVGVISTNLGAGSWNISGCAGNGDNGMLQSTPPGGTCSGPAGAYIQDVVNADGSRTTNYTGTLSDTFSCIANLGINGCGFEQPLEAMRRALDGTIAGNAGFLRAGAVLAVIIVSDEDDCSTQNTDMFDTSQKSPTDPLGPLSSFRCFEFGVVCSPDTPRTIGSKTGCVSREDSAYMYAMAPYVDFLKSLKADPNRVVVGLMAGAASPVTVTPNTIGNPLLSSSCSSATGDAAPPIRLQTFANGFAGNASISNLCDDNYNGALADIAAKITAVLP